MSLADPPPFTPLPDTKGFYDTLIPAVAATRDTAGLQEYLEGIDFPSITAHLCAALCDTRPQPSSVKTALATALSDLQYPPGPFRRAAGGGHLREPHVLQEHHLTDLSACGSASCSGFGSRWKGRYGGVAVDALQISPTPPSGRSPEDTLLQIAALLRHAKGGDQTHEIFPPFIGALSGPRLVVLSEGGVPMVISEQIYAHRSGMRRWNAAKVCKIFTSAVSALSALEGLGMLHPTDSTPLRDRLQCDARSDPSPVRLLDVGFAAAFSSNFSQPPEGAGPSPDRHSPHLLAELLRDVMSYRCEGQPHHAGPTQLREIEEMCVRHSQEGDTSGIKGPDFLGGVARRLAEAVPQVMSEAPLGCADPICHEIPFASQGVSYSQWSVPEEARSMVSEALRSGALSVSLPDIIGCDAELRSVGIAAASTPGLQRLDLLGPLPPEGCASTSTSPHLQGTLPAEGGAARVLCSTKALPRDKKLRLLALHAAVFSPSPEEPGWRTRPEGVYLEYCGIRGPLMHRWVDVVEGRSHPDTESHHHAQQARWAEYLKLAEVVAEGVAGLAVAVAGEGCGGSADGLPLPHRRCDTAVPRKGKSHAAGLGFALPASFWRSAADGISRATHLLEFAASRVRMSGPQTQMLCAALKPLPQLRCLSLVGCGLRGEAAFHPICDMLRGEGEGGGGRGGGGGGGLVSLDLSGNFLCPSTASDLFAAAGVSCVRSLVLSDCGAYDISNIASVFSSNSLAALDLSGNPFGERGAASLADALRGGVVLKSALRQLDVSRCGIGQAGAVSIVASLHIMGPNEWVLEGALRASRASA